MQNVCQTRMCWEELGAEVVNFWHPDRMYIITDGTVGITQQTENGMHLWFDYTERYASEIAMRAIWRLARIENL
jgi:hypothetical protein